MSFLLDTNVLSDATRPQPDVRVAAWLGAQSADELFLSVLTLGELRQGMLLLAEGKKRRSLLRWLEHGVEADFAGRILPVDALVMHRWAETQARARQTGQLLPIMDSLIAATARAHDLTLVTRNTEDFVRARIPLLNPWKSAGVM